MEDFFKGVRVIELSSVLAGPYAGMLFSELGAEVIKIENANGGDVTRSWKLPTENQENRTSAYYASVNYRKHVHFLDFKKMNHINKVYEMIKTADIVISNFKKGDDYKFALDYGRVKVINPRIIYAELKGFEFEPDRLAYDVVVQAETGFMSMNGHPNSPPTKMPVALMDVLAGHQLRTAIVSALWKREKTKKGAHIKTYLNKSGIAALVNQGTNYLMADKIPERIGSRHPNISLYGEVFTCKDDKELVLALGSNQHFISLCNALNAEHLTNQNDYKSNHKRLENLEPLISSLDQHFKEFTRDKLVLKFNELKVPFGIVNNLKEVAHSKQGKNMIRTENYNSEITKRFSTLGFEISQ